MARPRKQVYTLEMYLRKNRKGEIDNKADVQRNFVWSNEQINELVVTVLTDDYIPPIILGEEENTKLHIVDGGQRTAALRRFREMNYKITSSIENSLIPYSKKIIDEDGSVSYEDAMFDIKNKTYERLPEELKEKFDEYQIETVIHEHCDSFKISRYIKRYNNHVAMNTDQKAFTYIDKFASRIRKILDSKFFVECNSFSEKDKTKGVVERVIAETIMCMYHFENWKKQAKSICKYLNDNATMEEFDTFADNLHRLENIVSDEIKGVFNKKDAFIFLTLFHKFTKLGIEDVKFAEFLKAFQCNLRTTRRNDSGLLFDEIKKNNSTKDKSIITQKLSMLESLMLEFLHIGEESTKENIDEEGFISAIVGIDKEVLHEDMDFYNETLDRLESNAIKDGSKLLDKRNRLSLLAMMAYSYKNDVDLDEWLMDYAAKNNTYFLDQKKNFNVMLESFKNFTEKGQVA